MTFDFRYPQINGSTEKEQLMQMKTYMHQLVDQLKWALNSIETKDVNYIAPTTHRVSNNVSTANLDDDTTQVRFNELKPLIIKSAEIVNAYYEEINRRLEGIYVAQSDFGAFVEQTSKDIESNSTETTLRFNNVQTIITQLDTDIGSINGNIQNIDSTVQTLDSSVQQINTKVSTIDSYTATIGTKVNTIDTKVTTIDTGLKSVESSVGALDTNIKSVEQNVGSLDTTLKTVEGSVTNLDTNLKAVETDLNDTKVGIGSSLESISEEVGVIDKDLQGVKAGVESDIKGLSNEIGGLDTKLEDAKSAINSDIGKLRDDLKTMNTSIVDVKAHIKSGLIDYDNEIPVYGLEVGQKNTINGVEVFNKYARFTAGRLSFYDNNGTEVAYISDYKLYITNAEVTGTLKLGKYLIETSRGLTFKWVERS